VSAAGATALETLVRRVRGAGHQLWLAGLGAAATAAATAAAAPRLAAQGRQLVQRLAEKAERAERAERHVARVTRIGARIESLTGRAGRTVRGAGTLLRETAEYETRRLLERLDLATVEDLRLLAAHLETLDKKLDDYSRRSL
jgi:Poly(hydroxyalcanoate) granule associated protein (phasin)